MMYALVNKFIFKNLKRNPNPKEILLLNRRKLHATLTPNYFKIYEVHHRIVVNMGKNSVGKRRVSYQNLNIVFNI